MNKFLIVPLVVLAGAGVCIQVAMNSKLKDALQSPALVAAIAFGLGSLAMIFLTLNGVLGRGDLSKMSQVPTWSWFGGLFSVLAVTIQMIAKDQGSTGAVIAGTVLGQLLSAMLIDHFGWLGVKQESINWQKIVGAVLLFGGAALMGMGKK